MWRKSFIFLSCIKWSVVNFLSAFYFSSLHTLSIDYCFSNCCCTPIFNSYILFLLLFLLLIAVVRLISVSHGYISFNSEWPCALWRLKWSTVFSAGIYARLSWLSWRLAICIHASFRGCANCLSWEAWLGEWHCFVGLDETLVALGRLPCVRTDMFFLKYRSALLSLL